jgi:translation initiation factor 1
LFSHAGYKALFTVIQACNTTIQRNGLNVFGVLTDVVQVEGCAVFLTIGLNRRRQTKTSYCKPKKDFVIFHRLLKIRIFLDFTQQKERIKATFAITFAIRMTRKKKNNARVRLENDGMVFSTQPGWTAMEESDASSNSAATGKQLLYVSLDRKQRAGKPVTLVEGYSGDAMELLLLGKELKTTCGVGGAVKEGCVLIQGDQRKKVIATLEGMGHQVKSKGG